MAREYEVVSSVDGKSREVEQHFALVVFAGAHSTEVVSVRLAAIDLYQATIAISELSKLVEQTVDKQRSSLIVPGMRQ
jgi:hypothetical protein